MAKYPEELFVRITQVNLQNIIRCSPLTVTICIDGLVNSEVNMEKKKTKKKNNNNNMKSEIICKRQGLMYILL